MNKERIYANLGFLDFMAYYVPGVLIVVSIILYISKIEPQFNLNTSMLPNGQYIQGAIWTMLLLVVPYVIGHLIFPAGYLVGGLISLVVNNILLIKNKYVKKQKDYSRKKYCKLEDPYFAECLKSCHKIEEVGYVDMMIVRYRTLSRFCRSMLFPAIVIHFVFMIYFELFASDKNNLLPFVVFSLLFCFLGLAYRYIKYEDRWRNAICVGSNQLNKSCSSS